MTRNVYSANSVFFGDFSAKKRILLNRFFANFGTIIIRTKKYSYNVFPVYIFFRVYIFCTEIIRKNILYFFPVFFGFIFFALKL